MATLAAHAGLKLDADGDETPPSMANLRYTHDLLLFGKLLDEAMSILGLLQQQLAATGSTVNPKKATLLTMDPIYSLRDVPVLADAGDGIVEVAGNGTTQISWKGSLR